MSPFGVRASKDVSISIDDSPTAVATLNINGDLVITMPDGKEVSLFELFKRIEALEEAYMEKALLGSEPGKIKE